MPNQNRMGTVFVPSGSPDTVNYSPEYAPGERGLAYDYNDKAYQIVQLDSGATAATPTGIPAVNQLAYWRDKDRYVVTNDRRFAMNLGIGTAAYQNFVAGVIRNAATPGNIIHILQRGDNIPMLDGGNTFAAGESIIAEADAVGAVDRIALGTAVTFRPLGIARGAAANGVVNVDIDIPNIP